MVIKHTHKPKYGGSSSQEELFGVTNKLLAKTAELELNSRQEGRRHTQFSRILYKHTHTHSLRTHEHTHNADFAIQYSIFQTPGRFMKTCTLGLT